MTLQLMHASRSDEEALAQSREAEQRKAALIAAEVEKAQKEGRLCVASPRCELQSRVIV